MLTGAWLPLHEKTQQLTPCPLSLWGRAFSEGVHACSSPEEGALPLTCREGLQGPGPLWLVSTEVDVSRLNTRHFRKCIQMSGCAPRRQGCRCRMFPWKRRLCWTRRWGRLSLDFQETISAQFQHKDCPACIDTRRPGATSGTVHDVINTAFVDSRPRGCTELAQVSAGQQTTQHPPCVVSELGESQVFPGGLELLSGLLHSSRPGEESWGTANC